VDGGLGTRCHAKFGVDVLDVSLSGTWADEQPCGYLAVRQALTQESQHVDLAARQAVLTSFSRPYLRGTANGCTRWDVQRLDYDVS
jgi:hypothetical protein